MEAELNEAFPDSTVELVGGKGGIFEVTLDGSTVYEKDRETCDRFPEEGEV
ncbi:MAG: Rdx family protein, partial [Candidatus Krumholzibacteria bacterium]|nr:Rdx family protein [Candidatus Krumholzibacteria bacterium]